MGDEVQIERTRSIDQVAAAAECGFDAAQRRQGLARRQRRLDKSQTIEVVRLPRVRPGGRAPPRRSRHQLEPGGRKIVQRRLQQGLARAKPPSQATPKSDQDGVVEHFNKAFEIMTFYPTDRIALFIDGANLYSAAKSLGFDIDYKKLLAE